MTLEQALERIGVDPGDDEAFAVVERFVHDAAGRRCHDPVEAEDIAQDVLLSVLERLARGGLCVRSNGEGLLRIMVRSRCIDRARRRRAAGEREARYGGDTTTEPVEPVVSGWPVLEALVTRAIAQRAERHRPHTERAWRELQRVCLEQRPFREVVAEQEGLAPGDPVDGKTMWAAYKRQERFRADLARAHQALAAEGALDEAQHELALAILDALVYCHKSSPRDGQQA